MAEAAARERKRLAWAARTPGVTIAPTSAPTSAPAAVANPVGEVGAVAADLRAIARAKRWEERLDDGRIAALAPLIVAEAARYGIPPALVIAIVHLESEYNPSARSPVGATGLMQVMPSWPGDLRYRFGRDLTDEATNVRYGTWVLQDALAASGGDARRALLRYNGCRRAEGLRCSSYPDRVRALVESAASASCGGRDWEACVAEPLRAAYVADD